ncbi:MAG: hypothetical protein IIZ39_14750, partial [Blautia sp.]|nr:hypothetical protein [Blautia sp.]
LDMDINDAFWDLLLKAQVPKRIQEKLSRENLKLLFWEEIGKLEEYRLLWEKVHENVQRNLELSTALLESIPASCAGLYPLARRMHRHFILHVGPTNSGKTHEAITALEEAGEGIYLGPLRLLAYEQYERMNAEGFPCSLVTGEEERIIPGASFQASTAEMASLSRPYRAAVIDEAQMMADKSRGGAWTAAILGLCAAVIHVCLSPEAEDLCKAMVTECGDSFEVIYHERKCPLEPDSMRRFSFPEDVQEGDALLVFSRKDVHGVAAELQENNIPCSIIYGALPYDVRHQQAEDFSKGRTKVVVATDAIGMGMNLPIRRVVFLERSKYDGLKRRELLPQEYRQLAGRAGRFGLHEKGFFTALGSKGEKKEISQRIQEEAFPIKKAYLSFPSSLRYMGDRLSETLFLWTNLPDPPGYAKESVSSKIILAEMAEEITKDRDLIYTFACFPFNHREDALLDVWKGMLLSACDGKHYSCPEWVLIAPNPRNNDLAALERQYRALDMLYYYKRHFEPEAYENLEEIRENLSHLILEILRAQKLKQRTCRYCQKKLPWYHPYAMCDECHRDRYSSRDWYYGGGNWYEDDDYEDEDDLDDEEE